MLYAPLPRSCDAEECTRFSVCAAACCGCVFAGNTYAGRHALPGRPGHRHKQHHRPTTHLCRASHTLAGVPASVFAASSMQVPAVQHQQIQGCTAAVDGRCMEYQHQHTSTSGMCIGTVHACRGVGGPHDVDGLGQGAHRRLRVAWSHAPLPKTGCRGTTPTCKLMDAGQPGDVEGPRGAVQGPLCG